MGSTSSLTFVRRPMQMGARRTFFSIPPEVARLLSFDQTYEVILRPVGSLVWRAG